MNIPYIFKRCNKCGEWLVANSINFHKQKRGKHGLTSQCKKCKEIYKKQHYQDNKEHYKEYGKQYRQENKEQVLERRRQYYQENKEYYKEYGKQYRQENKERYREYKKQYYQENKEHYREYGKQHRQEKKEYYKECKKQYYQDNKEHILERTKQHHQENKEYYREYNKQYRQSPQGQVAQFNGQNKRRQREQDQGRGINKEQWLEMMNFFGWTGAYSGVYIGEKGSKNRSIDHIIPLNKGGLNEPWNCVPMERSLNSSKRDKDMLEWYQEQPFYSEERLAKIYEWQEYAYNKWGQDIAM